MLAAPAIVRVASIMPVKSVVDLDFYTEYAKRTFAIYASWTDAALDRNRIQVSSEPLPGSLSSAQYYQDLREMVPFHEALASTPQHHP